MKSKFILPIILIVLFTVSISGCVSQVNKQNNINNKTQENNSNSILTVKTFKLNVKNNSEEKIVVIYDPTINNSYVIKGDNSDDLLTIITDDLNNVGISKDSGKVIIRGNVTYVRTSNDGRLIVTIGGDFTYYVQHKKYVRMFIFKKDVFDLLNNVENLRDKINDTDVYYQLLKIKNDNGLNLIINKKDESFNPNINTRFIVYLPREETTLNMTMDDFNKLIGFSKEVVIPRILIIIPRHHIWLQVDYPSLNYFIKKINTEYPHEKIIIVPMDKVIIKDHTTIQKYEIIGKDPDIENIKDMINRIINFS